MMFYKHSSKTEYAKIIQYLKCLVASGYLIIFHTFFFF